MALFKRNKTTDDDVTMPQELQDYYAAENRSNGWMPWVLGLLTLLVTVVVALGLFYGGRYAYRKIRSNDNKPQTAQNQNQREDDDDGDDNEEENSDAEQTATTTTPPTTGTTTTPQTSSTSTSTPSTTTPATAGARTNIPNTGPESTLAIFAAVTLLGYLAHRKFATK